jgi:hypothetical protein
MKKINIILLILIMIGVVVDSACARIKLVALPERLATMIRLDNPQFTLIEEERVLTLQRGVNKVDFSWKGVSIDPDSIRLSILTNPNEVKLLNVSYPPNEQALVWEISSTQASEEKVRVSYLLSNIDRLITYKALADKEETKVDLKSYLILRNFSGEDFDLAHILLDFGETFEQGIAHEETKQLLFTKNNNVPIEKVWRWDSNKQTWDPEKVDHNVGIPVTYRITNDLKSGLGKNVLFNGKVRVFQEDGHGSTILLGEDKTALVPMGEDMNIYIGDSRDIVVTQRKMIDKQINVKRNTSNRIVLSDQEEKVVAKIENFKDKKAILTVVEHIPGEWIMKKTNFEYILKDANTLEYEIELSANSKEELVMHYVRKNIRN